MGMTCFPTMIFSVELWCFFATIAVLLLGLYYRKVNYWPSRNVPGPIPWPLVGNVIHRFYRPLFEIDNENIAKYGKVYGEHEPFEPNIIVADPELVKQIFVKDFKQIGNRTHVEYWNDTLLRSIIQVEGQEWKWLRDKLTPPFSAAKMKRMFPIMKECSEGTLEYLEAAVGSKTGVELKKLFGCYTLDVLSRCCFSTKIKAIRDEESDVIRNSKKIMALQPLNYFLFQICPRFLLKYFRITLFDADGLQYFADLTEHVIKEREDDATKHDDFLQFLIEEHKNPKDGKELTIQDIVSSAMVFFPAGYDTTALTLAYCVYEAAVNPKMQDRLRKEVSDAFPTEDDLEYYKLSSLQYLDAFMCEVLRKYPPIIRTTRMANENYELTNDIVIPKGIQVHIPIYSIHHSDEYFTDPERFDPERFFPENRDSIRPFTYMPFGEGPRMCLGKRFAMLHTKLAVSRILLRYRIVKTAETRDPLEFENGNFVLRAQIIVGCERIS